MKFALIIAAMSFIIIYQNCSKGPSASSTLQQSSSGDLPAPPGDKFDWEDGIRPPVNGPVFCGNHVGAKIFGNATWQDLGERRVSAANEEECRNLAVDFARRTACEGRADVESYISTYFLEDASEANGFSTHPLPNQDCGVPICVVAASGVYRCESPMGVNHIWLEFLSPNYYFGVATREECKQRALQRAAETCPRISGTCPGISYHAKAWFSQNGNQEFEIVNDLLCQ